MRVQLEVGRHWAQEVPEPTDKLPREVGVLQPQEKEDAVLAERCQALQLRPVMPHSRMLRERISSRMDMQ